MDVRIEGTQVAEVGPPHSAAGADLEIVCDGNALLPGLHDHHLHLLSMAAAARSIDVSHDLDRAVARAHAGALPGVPLRAVNYDEMEGGALDRWRLDALAPGRAVRVQHRSGAAWVLSTVALEQIGALDAEEAGIERDKWGQPTGRLFRLDDWMRARRASYAGNVPAGTAEFAEPVDSADPADFGGTADLADLAAVGSRLASFGVTGVTDCTPTASVAYFAFIATAVRDGTLPLTVLTTGGPELAEVVPPEPLRRGPVKVVIADHALPPIDELIECLARAHRAGRAVAVHCVTRAALVLALAAWREVGSVPGDRIEHASVTPPDLVAAIAELSLIVVTQPAFIAARGDVYLREVDPVDRPDLYRCASLLDSGIAVGGSTDAPFGPDDPWLAIRAAIERRSRSGALVGSDRGLLPVSALDLFLAPLDRPGGPSRHVTPGASADLCLLDVPLHVALADVSSWHVATTIAQGKCTFVA
jgi:predicted amidohydrolase YtcJ